MTLFQPDTGPRRKRMKHRKLYSSRKAKKHWIYDIKAVCDLYGVSRNTPLNWMKAGLEPIAGGKPYRFRGDELNRFHAERRECARKTIRDNELYCLSCKAPKLPAPQSVNVELHSSGAGIVSGRCPDCGSDVSRFASPTQVALICEECSVKSNATETH